MRPFLVICLLLCLTALAGAGSRLDLLAQDAGWHLTSKPLRLVNAKPLRLSTKQYPLLIVEIKQSGGKLGEVSWRAQNESFSFFNSLPFYLQSSNKAGKYFLNLAAYNRSGKMIDQLVIFPVGQEGTGEILSLIASSGSLNEMSIAGWQEFWGPLGREPDGFNFLVIRSARLFGRTMNYFLNIFLAICLLYAWRSGKRREFLLVLLAAWLFLEASSLLNNWLAFQRDTRCFGQTLEQKRALINTRDYYPFLMFADKVLPPGAGFDIATPIADDAARATYYLYPRLRQPDPPYILVFKQPLRSKLTNNYYLWKTFQPGIYILKAKSLKHDSH